MYMLIQIIAGIFLFGLLVFFHELGHFLMGKLVKVHPKKFSIGYGRGFIFKKWKRTLYQITLIPLGGYVQFYGDDLATKYASNTKAKPGDFFYAGPWKRIIIALGGPFFSVLLGLIIIACLIVGGWRPTLNQIQIAQLNTPASKVLKTGDHILAVNGTSTTTYEEIAYEIGLAKEDTLQVKFARNGKEYQKNITGIRNKPGAPLQIGVIPYGSSELVLREDVELLDNFKKTIFLNKGNTILKANGISVTSVKKLSEITTQNIKKNITLEVKRTEKNWLFLENNSHKIETITVPIKSMQIIELTQVKNLETGELTDNIQLHEQLREVDLKKIEINQEVYTNWNNLKQAIQYHLTNNHPIKLRTNKITYQVKPVFKEKGLIGIQLQEKLNTKKITWEGLTFLTLIKETWKQAIFTTKGTLVGLWRIIQGKLSFSENVAGPIKILKFSGQTVSLGWEVYWFFLANISIILGIMNLLPIPVLDGGHVLFYLIEGLYKPLPNQVIKLSIQFGMVFLLSFGIYVIFLDIWDVFLSKFL